MMIVNYSNRGKGFEDAIMRSNLTYKYKKWACIEKTEPIFKPLPNGALPNRYRGNKNIKVGYYEGKGFVDFFGVCQGRAIAFEAKSTTIRTSFPLSNISSKQYKDLEFWHKLGGIAFILVQFAKQHEVFVLKFKDLQKCWEESKKGGRKSIPYAFFNLNCDKVKATRGVILDYLDCLDIQQ
jgi:recombination protein U